MVAADADLDDAIRNLFSAAESFDRDNLGAAHGLAPHAAKLKAQATAVRAAITAQETAIRVAKNAAAEEEIAQAALRRTYEGNYLAVRGSLGRTVAERLFPKANRGQAAETPVAPTPPPA